MPVISVEYDKTTFNNIELSKVLSKIQEITARVSGELLEDTPLSARSYETVLAPCPMEVYIRVSKNAIPDHNLTQMLDNISSELAEYKKVEHISQPINIMVIPMDWEFKLNI